LIFNRNN